MISKKRSAGRAGVRGLSLTVVALLALAIVGVSGAFASNSFTTAQRNWGMGPWPGVKLVGARPVTASLNGSSLLYQSTLFGTPVEWTASGVECPDCKIENRVGTGGKTEAVFSGQMSLTGVKSIKPAGCTMPSTLQLRPITGVLGGSNIPGNITGMLSPSEGTSWDSYELNGCGFSGVYNWTGAAFGGFKNALGVAAKTQEFSLSQSLQEYLGSSGSMKFAGNPAFLSASIKLTEEEEFQVRESFPVNEGNAFTTPSTNPLIPRNWYTGAQPGTKLSGTQAVETSLASEKLTFNTKVGEVSTKFTATGLECSGCKIENRAGTGENKGNTEAAFSGALSFTGLKVVSPSNCSMPSTLKTKPLTGVIGGEKGSSTKATVQLEPTEGISFATAELAGASCPLAGLYKLNGKWFGEFVNPLGTDAKTQRIRLNQAIQELLGTSTSLKFGVNPVAVIGEANMSSAVEFQAKEQ